MAYLLAVRYIYKTTLYSFLVPVSWSKVLVRREILKQDYLDSDHNIPTIFFEIFVLARLWHQTKYYLVYCTCEMNADFTITHGSREAGPGGLHLSETSVDCWEVEFHGSKQHVNRLFSARKLRTFCFTFHSSTLINTVFFSFHDYWNKYD